jgi:hypothetical protein
MTTTTPETAITGQDGLPHPLGALVGEDERATSTPLHGTEKKKKKTTTKKRKRGTRVLVVGYMFIDYGGDGYDENRVYANDARERIYEDIVGYITTDPYNVLTQKQREKVNANREKLKLKIFKRIDDAWDTVPSTLHVYDLQFNFTRTKIREDRT